MADTRANLLMRKADLLAALRLIEQDYKDGVVDEDAYRTARQRYEQEAAEVLERLDALPPAGDAGAQRPSTRGTALPRWVFVAGTGVLVLAAMVLFLVLAIHPRSGSQTITGDAGQSNATAPPSPRLLAAEREARAHPRSLVALVNLGNAYMNNGQVASADRTYQAAMKLDPSAPQPATLHAMILGYGGRPQQAHALLQQVERGHPAYSRAWLLDGMFSFRSHRAYAIAAWQRFLALDPNGPFSARVRGWIAQAKKAAKSKK